MCIRDSSCVSERDLALVRGPSLTRMRGKSGVVLPPRHKASRGRDACVSTRGEPKTPNEPRARVGSLSAILRGKSGAILPPRHQLLTAPRSSAPSGAIGEARHAARAPSKSGRGAVVAGMSRRRAASTANFARAAGAPTQGGTRRSHLKDRSCGRGAGQRALDVSASAPCCMPE